MNEYFNFFVALVIISIVAVAITLAATDPKKNKITRILLLIIAAIVFIIGAGGCFLMTISNVGSYRY